ncbi:MAG: acyl carrier protein [Clostridia bacterium]|nr:acyl carrier protein [Clostridia bacterium]
MLDKLKEILGRVNTDIDIDSVTEETRIVEDLGLDSLSVMLFALELEAAFDFRFTEPVRFETVGQVCDFVADKIDE